MALAPKKDASFILKAILFSLLIMAALNLSAVRQPGDEDSNLVTQADDSGLISIRASEVPPLLKSADGKPTMLFIYASWCAYCKRVMPNIIDMLRNNELSHLNPVFVSLDTKLPQLTKYLQKNNYQDFKPYVVKRNAANPLYKALETTGSHFPGSIPYIAFFDANGRLISEIQGMPQRTELRAAIHSIR